MTGRHTASSTVAVPRRDLQLERFGFIQLSCLFESGPPTGGADEAQPFTSPACTR